MGILDLPEELYDLVRHRSLDTWKSRSWHWSCGTLALTSYQIIDHLIACPQHPKASTSAPCLQWHANSKIREITGARRVNRDFCDRLSPIIFAHICFRGHHRHQNLLSIASSPLAPMVRTLRVEIAPQDFGRAWSDEVHGYPIGERALAYFDDLKAFLIPVLSRLSQVHTLHLTTTYHGLHLAGTSRGHLLFPCFATLCEIIRSARLTTLETVQIGVPYEGGYAGFFGDASHRKILEGVSDNIQTASVKLSDWQHNFTTMPIF